MTPYERGWRDGVEAAAKWHDDRAAQFRERARKLREEENRLLIAEHRDDMAGLHQRLAEQIRAIRPVEPAPEPAPRDGITPAALGLGDVQPAPRCSFCERPDDFPHHRHEPAPLPPNGPTVQRYPLSAFTEPAPRCDGCWDRGSHGGLGIGVRCSVCGDDGTGRAKGERT